MGIFTHIHTVTHNYRSAVIRSTATSYYNPREWITELLINYCTLQRLLFCNSARVHA